MQITTNEGLVKMQTLSEHRFAKMQICQKWIWAQIHILHKHQL